jgi:hypothetical protein
LINGVYKLRQLFLSLSFLACCGVHPLLAVDWKPISPEDLALKAPRVDPTADAEALFWDISVANGASNNQYPFTTFSHYLRVKIFTERGVKNYGTVNITYNGKQLLGSIAGRTIQPDGSIQELTKDAIFDRVDYKGSGLKVRTRSFAMPRVKPGSIIEYQWREERPEEIANYVHLPAQREFPVEELVYHLKPLVNPYFPYRMRYVPFNCTLPPFQQERDGYFTSTMKNIPAYVEEEDMPPENEIRPWVLIYYDEDRKDNLEKFWKSEGKRTYSIYKPELKVNGDVKSLAAQLVAGVNDENAQVVRLYEYCRNKIKDLSSDDVSESDRQGWKGNHNTAETLKRGIGTPLDIQLAFAALATAAGFDARIAELPDRGDIFFKKEFLSSHFLRSVDVAIKVDGNWRLYDVSSPYLEPGRLRWEEEGVVALISDDSKPEWISTAVTPALSSRYQRSGNLKLDEQGTLEGDVTETLLGHPAEEWRVRYRGRSTQQREETLRNDTRNRLPGADVTSIVLSDPKDLSQPVKFSYHVRVQAYAMRTGKRLFVTPAFFEFNLPARYTAAARKYEIYFRYPWSEIDDVVIQAPKGYELDHADAPPSLVFAPVGSYKLKISVTKTNRIIFHRELIFGNNQLLLLAADAYPKLKGVFDAIHDRDTHLLTLKAQQVSASNIGGK